MVDEILLNETQKVTSAREAPKFLSMIVMRTIHIRLIKLILRRLKKNFNDVSMRLNSNNKIHTGLKSEII